MTVTRSTRRVGVIAAAGTLVASSAAATIVLLATGGSAYATTSVGAGLPDPTISPTALLSPTPLPTTTSTTTTVVPLPTLSATSSPTPTASPTATPTASAASTSGDTTTSTSTNNSTRTTTSSGATRNTAGSNSKTVAVKGPASVKLPATLSVSVPSGMLPSVVLAKAEMATFVPPTLSIPEIAPILLPSTAGEAAPAQGLAPLLAGPMMPYAAPSGANAPAAAPVHDNVNLAASRNGTGGGAPIIMFGLCVFAILLGMRGAGRLRVRIRAKLRG